MALGKNTTALVTGASSGIGEATVRALRAEGVIVHAAARRLDRLEKLAGETGCIPHQLDVRDRAAVKAFGENNKKRIDTASVVPDARGPGHENADAFAMYGAPQRV